MEAVKMPSTAQVKSQVRTASADTPKGGDEFMKLLQVKKEQAQPEDTDVKQTDSQDGRKDTEDVSAAQDKKEDSGEDGEKVSSEDETRQDALLQAAMQQTAAQMAGVVTEQPRENTAEAVKTDIAAPAEVTPGEETVSQPETAEAVGQTMEAVREPEQKQSDASGGNEEQNADNGFKALEEEKVLEKEPEIQSYKSRTEAKPQEKVQTGEKTEGHEGLYGATTARTETEHSFGGQKAEEIPLKTSEDTLPQDLGKTLADRLPGTGRELVVELEPANLGKLTIKMVYDAGRAAVSIMASNPKTLEILNQKAAEIAAILEEKTGQETLIYTQAPQQESQEENPNENQGSRGGQQGQEQRHQAGEDRHHDVESFAQQLRLGLV